MVEIVRVSGFNNLNGPTSGTRVSAQAEAPASASKKKAEDLNNQFLSMLLTQMQNQNPTDPMDTKELTAQLAQFSSLEQQISTNEKLDNLITASNSNASTAAFGYIGQTAELKSNMTALENGEADWKYSLNGNADKINLKIKDEQGRVVYERNDRNIQSGTYSLNAKTSDFSFPVKNGQVLKLEIVATDIANKKITNEISTTVKVDGVESGPNGIDLRAGGLLFGLGDVTRFKTVAAPTAPSAT